MNKFINTTIILSFFILGINCNSNKNISTIVLQEKVPFKVLKATYSNWAGGQPGVKGYKIFIEIDNSSVQLDSVYFRGRIAAFNKELKLDKNYFNAVIVLPNDEKDYNLNIDAKKEFGNTPPNVSEFSKINFQLKENEAVLKYIFNKKPNYTKITKLVEDNKSATKLQ